MQRGDDFKLCASDLRRPTSFFKLQICDDLLLLSSFRSAMAPPSFGSAMTFFFLLALDLRDSFRDGQSSGRYNNSSGDVRKVEDEVRTRLARHEFPISFSLAYSIPSTEGIINL
nr:hypothetical protein Iba_chr10cCG7360 [Ipomoea batatas]